MSITIDGVRIADMPDLGAFNDTSSIVGERAGSGRFGAAGLAGYFATKAYVDGQVAGQAGTRPYIVATITALRALTTAIAATAAWVQGYRTPADGGEGMFCYVSTDTTSADNGGTIIVDASGRRWYRATQSQALSVHWFGAVGDGVTNDGPAVQLTQAAVVARGGGNVTFSAKTYNLASTTLAVTASKVRFQGAGQFSTVLLFSGANDIFTFVGSAYSKAGFINGNGVSDLSITCSGKTGGRTFFTKFCFNALFQRVYINNAWDGFDNLSCNTVTCRDMTFNGMIGGNGTRGFYFHAPADASAPNIEMNLDNVTVACVAADGVHWSGADGIVWDGAAYTLNLYNVTLLDVRIGLYVLNSAASNAYYPQWLEATTFTVDGASSYAVNINGGGNFKFNGCNLQNTSGEANQGGLDNQALVILTDTGHSETHEVYFSNCLIGLSRLSAVLTGGKNVAFSQCRFAASVMTLANTVPAVQVTTGAADTRISDCSAWYYGNPNNWSYAVQMDAGSLGTLVIGGSFNNAGLSGTFNDNSGTGTNTFANDFIGAPTATAGPITRSPVYVGDPATPAEGEFYFNHATKKGRMWDGTTWNDLW